MIKIALLRAPLISEDKTIHARQLHPPFDLKYIQSILGAEGCHISLTDCWVEPHTLKGVAASLLDYAPEMLVISATNYNYDWSRELASILKSEGKDMIIVAIGADASSSPKRYRYEGSPFDVCIRGEPEEEILSFVKGLKAGRPACRTGGDAHGLIDGTTDLCIVKDLDSLPPPQYTKEEIRRYNFLYPLPLRKKIRWGFLISSRGCWHKCSFCSCYIRKSFGKTVRFRKPEHVADEIEGLKKIGVNMVSFEDDDFTLSRKHLRSVCSEIKRRGIDINWSCHARLDELDSEILGEMKEAGCALLLIGMESGSLRMHSLLEKFARPELVLKKGHEILKEARRHNISTHLLFMLGLPTEGSEDIAESMEAAKRLSSDTIQMHFFTPYPDSRLYSQYKDRIAPELDSKMYHYSYPALNMSNLSDEALREKYTEFYRNHYLNAGYMIRHAKRYGLFYLFNPSVLKGLFSVMVDVTKREHKG
ncbi:MAG: radical SAM protein [Candidatus Omnitrophica bacterium]|nr:radical SAM protein [Candidatus Omnitrophota bacterium]